MESHADFAALINKRKRTALGWLQQDPLGRLVLLRRVLQPLTQLLNNYLTKASVKWELEQRRLEATAGSKARQNLLAGGLDYVNLPAKTSFQERLAELRGPGPWGILHHKLQLGQGAEDQLGAEDRSGGRWYRGPAGRRRGSVARKSLLQESLVCMELSWPRPSLQTQGDGPRP